MARRVASVALLVSLHAPAAAQWRGCRDAVFSGVAVSCNLQADGTVAECCDVLRGVARERCLCDPAVLADVLRAVGDDGLEFLRSFANRECETDLPAGPEGCLSPGGAQSGPPPAPQVGGPPPAPQIEGPPAAPQVDAPPRASPPAPPPGRQAAFLRTVGEIVSDDANALSLGFLADALVAAGLDGLLNTAGPYTLFAPTNAAWYEAMFQLGVTREELFADPALAEVLLFHVVPGSRYTSEMRFGQQLATLHASAPTVARALRFAVQGGADAAQAALAYSRDLTVETFDGLFVRSYFVEGSQVVTADQSARNGVVHIIDAVNLPPPPEPLPTRRAVADVVTERFELSIYEQALRGTGLLHALERATPTDAVTCFAPTNFGFVKFAATSPGLFVQDDASREFDPTVPRVNQTLKYGLVRGRYTTRELALAPNARLTTVEGSTLYVDYFRGRFRDAVYVNGCRVRARDLIGTNGVVHTLECVPEPRTTMFAGALRAGA